MRTYRQLTQAQRYQIYVLNRTGHSRTEIADVVGVHKSSISRELKRNRGQRGYRPQQAHEMALERRSKAAPRITAKVWTRVDELLKQEWSPEQISGRLKRNKTFGSVMNGFIIMFLRISGQAATCTSTCVVKRNAENAMEPMIGGVNCLIVAPSKSAQPL